MVIFIVMLVLVLYLALLPNVHNTMLTWLPRPVHRWLATHDDVNNILAFAMLGLTTFMVRPWRADRAGRGGQRLFAPLPASTTARLCCLLALVCVLETAQRWIPGRVCDLRDVATGWSGVFAAWLLYSVLDRDGKNSGTD